MPYRLFCTSVGRQTRPDEIVAIEPTRAMGQGNKEDGENREQEKMKFCPRSPKFGPDPVKL